MPRAGETVAEWELPVDHHNPRHMSERQKRNGTVVDGIYKRLKLNVYPKRARNAYMVFLSEMRSKMKKHGIKSKDVAMEAAKRWKKLSEKDKAPYEEISKAEKKAYAETMVSPSFTIKRPEHSKRVVAPKHTRKTTNMPSVGPVTIMTTLLEKYGDPDGVTLSNVPRDELIKMFVNI